MNLNFIGVGGAFCPELGCNSAYIKEDGKILFFDFGMDVFNKVVKYNVLDGVKEVFVAITHTHGDHIGGLFTFVDYCYFYKKIVVQILDNSSTFTNKLVKLLEYSGIESSRFRLIKDFELNFSFDLKFEKTTHTPLLECYSLVLEKEGKRIFYSSDTNDLKNIENKVKNNQYKKIYCEVGENSLLHLEFEDLKKINRDKLVLMHFQSVELYNEAIKEGFSVPNYLK